MALTLWHRRWPAMVGAALVGSVIMAAGLLAPGAGQAVGATPPGRAAIDHGPALPVGLLYAWGDDDAGQLGVGTISDAADHFDTDAKSPEWVDLPAGTVTQSAAAGQASTDILTTTGQVYASGFNAVGELGDGNLVATTSPVLTAIPAGVTVTAVAAGFKQSVALTSTGAVYTWGKNNDDQDADPAKRGSVFTPQLVAVPAGVTVTAIGAGANHDLTVTSSGQVYDWGLNSAGQLGDGNTTNSDVPVLAELPAGTVATAVAGGAGHSLALTATGEVFAWGDNTYGELGNGTTISSDVPVPVDLPAGVVVVAIAAGDGSVTGLTGGYSLALTSTGAIYAWGINVSGTLGDGSTTNSDVPVLVQVPAGVTPVAITAGGNRCHLLSSTGAIYDWGSTEKGTHVHLVPTLDVIPAGMTPMAIYDGPAAEQYLAVMTGSSLELTKSSTSTYSTAGQTLTYTYGVTDTGTTSLTAVSVADDLVTPADLVCPESALTTEATETCTGTYVTTDNDVTAGSVTNTAVATAESPTDSPVTSATARYTVTAT